VLNPESIRNASFSLMPSGYNPEQVDDALNSIAERLVAGEAITDLVGQVTFDAAEVGYAQPEVDHFFAELGGHAASPADQPSEDAEPEEQETVVEAVATADEQVESTEIAAEEPAAEQVTEAGADEADHQADESHDQPVEDPDPVLIDADADDDLDADADDWTDDAGDVYVGSPQELTWNAPTAGVLDLNVLGDAVDRTAETLGSLRGFIDNEIVAMKLAVERQAQETAKRCEQLLHDASAEAAALTESVNAEIARARKAGERQAERERRQLAKELKQARAECDAEVAAIRKDAEAYAAKVRAEADRDRAEAQRTIENAIGMQASIAESLERARQQLTPAQSDDLAA
jgi:DivIVA domain-containing protein